MKLREAGGPFTIGLFCVYLAEEDVRGTLRFISANAAPGSSLVVDCACRTMIDALKKYPNPS